jgi:hypothetical protein
MVDGTTVADAPTRETRPANPVDWRAGVVAGVLGAAAMAVLVSLMNPPTLAVAIPSLYALAPPANGVAGWVVHLSHGAVFGVGLAAAARFLPVDLGSVGRCTAVGVGYGVVIWVGAAALLMPVWLRAVGSPAMPPFPNFAPPSLLWHAVFGAVLGASYPVLSDLL